MSAAQLTITDLTNNAERTPTAQANRCGSCVYFVRFANNNKSLGECHVAAPIIWTNNPEMKNRFGMFPIVNDTNFCGEYASV